MFECDDDLGPEKVIEVLAGAANERSLPRATAMATERVKHAMSFRRRP